MLRARLTWAGFGMLQGGLWIAPAPVELSGFADGAGLEQHLRVFTAEAHPSTDIEGLAPSIWDLDELAAGYRAFVARWDDARLASRIASGSLALQLVLGQEWLELLRRDPRLPQRCLPADWPAGHAQAVFRKARATYAREAERSATELLGIACAPSA